jgi:hypothetical protein
MNKISSDGIRAAAIVSGILGLTLLAILMIVLVASGRAAKQPLLMSLLVFLALGIWLSMKKTVWNVVEEVLDGGDFLLLKKGNIEERVALSNISKVSAAVFWRPQKVTLSLLTPCKFGSEVSFIPNRQFRLLQGMESPLVDELRARLRRP